MSAPTKEFGQWADGTPRVFAFGKLPPTKAVPVMASIVKMIGGPIFVAFTGKGMKGIQTLAANMDDSAVAEAVGKMTANLDGDECNRVIASVLRSVAIVGGKDGVPSGDLAAERLDVVFAGRVMEMLQVFVHALKENFGFFLSAVPSASSPGASPQA